MAAERVPAPSGTRGRTRRAILEAAAAVWARDFSASLGDIAERAEVSRSTLHRYFADRQSLVDALLADSLELMGAAGASTVDAGATDALLSLLRTLIDMGDRVIFLFADPRRFEGHPLWLGGDGEGSLVPLIEQAQAERGLDPGFDPRWIEAMCYGLVYTAAESINNGVLPRHAAGDVAIRTLLQGFAPL